MNKNILNLNKWASLLLTFFFLIGVNVHNIHAAGSTITWNNGWSDGNFKYKIDVDGSNNLIATVSECIGSPTALNIPNFLNYNNNITLSGAADAADAASAAAAGAADAASAADADAASAAAAAAGAADAAADAARWADSTADATTDAARWAANAAANAAADAAAYAAVATAIAYDHSNSEVDKNAFGAATVALCAASQALKSEGNLLSNIKVTSIAGTHGTLSPI